jgi:hypothetical protein
MVDVNVSLPEEQSSTPPPQEPQNLTDLGRRTLSGYRLKWGPADGIEKFKSALESGYIDRAKMVGKKSAPKAKGKR